MSIYWSVYFCSSIIHLPPIFRVQLHSFLHYLPTISPFVHPFFIYPFSSLIPCIYVFVLHPYNTHPSSVFPLFVYTFTHLFIHCLSIHSSTHYSLICVSTIHPSFFHTSHNYHRFTHLSSHLSIPYIYLFIYCPSIYPHVFIHLSAYPSICSLSSIKLLSTHQFPIHCTFIHCPSIHVSIYLSIHSLSFIKLLSINQFPYFTIYIPNIIHPLSIHLLCITHSPISHLLATH